MKPIYSLFILLFLPALSYAGNCAVNATLFSSVIMGNILVQRDAPVGSEIARARVSGYAKLEVDAPDSPTSCSGAYMFNYLSAMPSSINNVFNTNLDGVGIRVSIPPGNFVLPSNGTAYIYNLGFYDVMLIKTGKITPGYLTPGVIMQGWFVTPDNYFMQISMDANTQVTVLACSLASQTLNFNLGDINASEFSNQAGFNPPRSDSQDLGLNCDASANINVELIGMQNPDAPGTADGVGIQVLYNNAPLQLNRRIVLKRSAGGQETFPLVARYYQTKSVVKPGSASTTATLNITYQ